jgi:hypothetical protein
LIYHGAGCLRWDLGTGTSASGNGQGEGGDKGYLHPVLLTRTARLVSPDLNSG